MRLSNNEFLSLLKRAFEGAGWTHGRYEDAAFAVWWIEAHGLNWLTRLADNWPRIDRAATAVPELIQAHAPGSVIDAAGASLLHCGSNSVDLVYANACSEPLATLETRRCVDRILIIPSLTTLATRGANALARWYADDVLHVVTIKSDESFPTYTRYELPESRDIVDSSLFLTCSRNVDGLNHYYRNVSKLAEVYNVLHTLSAEQLGRNANNSKANGIDVSDEAISLLNQAADRVLVEATEQSRQGAG